MRTHMIKVLIGGLLGVWFASAALALEPCNEVVVDDANILSTGDENRIATAAAELSELGVTVRVRISADTGRYATIRDAADNVCKTEWGGDRIVYWVMTESHDVGIYAGPVWANKISDSVAGDLIDTYMMPGLQSRSFANAFIQPIRATVELVRPIPVTVPQVVVTPQAPERTPVVIAQKPAANQWSFATVAAILAAFLVIIGGWFGLKFFTGERNRKDAIARTQQAAVVTGNQCSEMLQSFNLLETKLTELLAQQKAVLAESMTTSFTERLQTLLTDAVQINQEFNGHNDPATSGKELGWYEASLTSMKATQLRMQLVSETFQTLEDEITTTLQLAASMPKRLAANATEISAYQAQLTAIADAGFIVTSLQSELDTQKAVLADANAKATQKAYVEANDLLGQMSKESSRIMRTAEALPAQKNLLTKRLATLTHTFTGMPETITAAEKIFADIEDEYAESSYSSIAGNGTEAEARLDDVEELLAKVPAQLDKQQFAEAEATLDHVDTLLSEVSSLLSAILALAKRLNFAKDNVAIVLIEAKRSIKAALSYLSQYDADTSDRLLEPLTEAQKICEQVERMQPAAKPDYIEALALATKADGMADEVLAKAQGEHEQVERNRRQAETLRTRALHDAVDMQQYIKNHRSDVDRYVQSDFDAFAVELENLRLLGDSVAIINLARSISERSTVWKHNARRDFDAAEARRASARRAAERQMSDSSEDSSGATRSWGSTPAPRSSGASSSWRSSSSGASSGESRSFSSPVSRPSTGASRKW